MNRTEYSSLRQGLVGAWCPSLGASGLSLIDRSGFNCHGVLKNGATWAPQGINLSGTSQYIEAGDKDQLTFTGAFAISLHANIRSVSNYVPLMTKSDFGNNRREFLVYIDYAGADLGNGAAIGFVLMNTGSFGNRIARTAPIASVPTNAMAHYCAVHDGSKTSGGLSVFINGVRVDTLSSNAGAFTGITNQTTPVAIGADFNNYPTLGNQLNGIVDDIRLYSRALTLSEIRLLASRRGIGLTPLPDRAAGLPRRFSVNVGGTWREADSYVNVGGDWRLGQPSVNVGGVWK